MKLVLKPPLSAPSIRQKLRKNTALLVAKR
jgi:hypothetical protein